VASSADGTRLAASISGKVLTSDDSGVNWVVSSPLWFVDEEEGVSIAMSADGTKLVAAGYSIKINTALWVCSNSASGSIIGKQYDAVELQYVGNNLYAILSHEGDLFAQ
jgi:hypothetical protein